MNTKQIEEKYNLSFNPETNEGINTYWDLFEYFKNEIEYDNIVVQADVIHECCDRTNIENIIKNFNKKIKEIIENDPGPCDDPYQIGCRTLNNTIQNSNVIHSIPPPYNEYDNTYNTNEYDNTYYSTN